MYGYTPYVVPLGIAAAISMALALFVWRRRHAPGARAFALMMLAVTEWSLAYGLRLAGTDLETKLFWAKVRYLGIVVVPASWLVFSVRYAGQEKWLSRRTLALLVIEPVSILVLVWTNDWHHLFWQSVRLEHEGALVTFGSIHGVAFWLHAAYSYPLLWLGAFLLLQAALRSPHLYRSQAAAVLFGALAPLVGNMASVFGLNPFPHLDLTPFTFTLTGLMMAWALFRFQLLDIVPVARDAVIESMSEGVIVLDEQNRVVDLNPAARDIMGCTASEAIGQPAAQVFSDWPDLVGRYRDVTETHAEVALGANGAQRYFDLRISPLYDRRDRFSGRLITLLDVTERKQTEERLRQRTRELALVNQVGRALTSTLDLDQVLGALLDGIRHLLDVTASSVWLLDSETEELVCRQVTGPKAERVRGWRMAPGQGLAGWVVRHGESLIVENALVDERYFGAVAQQTGLDIHAVLTVPLQTKHGVLGVLQVVDNEVGRFSPDDLMLLEPLAATAASAIETARLYERARRDAETKSMLLREVNHRAKNNLSTIIGLLYAARRRTGMENTSAYQYILKDLINRLQGLATVHDLLSASKWTPLLLSELAAWVIRSALRTLAPERWVSVDVAKSPVRVTPAQAHDLTLIINELTINTFKYALQERDTAHIEVRIALHGDTVVLEFRDNGPGYPEEVLRMEHTSVGLDLVKDIVHKSLRGQLSLRNDHGALTIIQFKVKVQKE